MTTQSDRETIAARWLIEQDDPDFSDAQLAELTQWIRQSEENCRTYVRLVRAWRWAVLLHRSEQPGLTQAELADLSGMRVSDISQYEGGARSLTLLSMYVLARALRVPASRL